MLMLEQAREEVLDFFIYLNEFQKKGTYKKFENFCQRAPQSILKKFTKFCTSSLSTLRCQNNVPKSTNWLRRAQCALPSHLRTELCSSCSQGLIHVLKVAGRIWGHVHKMQRAHNPAWAVVHHLMDSLPEEKQIKNSAALGVKKAVSILSRMEVLS